MCVSHALHLCPGKVSNRSASADTETKRQTCCMPFPALINPKNAIAFSELIKTFYNVATVLLFHKDHDSFHDSDGYFRKGLAFIFYEKVVSLRPVDPAWRKDMALNFVACTIDLLCYRFTRVYILKQIAKKVSRCLGAVAKRSYQCCA